MPIYRQRQAYLPLLQVRLDDKLQVEHRIQKSHLSANAVQHNTVQHSTA